MSAPAGRLATTMLIVLGTSFAALAQSTETTDPQTDPASPTEITTQAVSEPSAEGLAAWEEIYGVLSHPRCINCHTPDEYPRWSGPSYGTARVHGMNVKRGDSGVGNPGLRCTTCHGETNSAKLHGPPGAEAWHLAPVEMVWWERSSGEVCAQIKDPDRNGGKTLAEVAEHVRDDPLVAWGWTPGAGREPAPGSVEETYQLLVTWIDEGAPCPKG